MLPQTLYQFKKIRLQKTNPIIVIKILYPGYTFTLGSPISKIAAVPQNVDSGQMGKK